jgi:hypothetical protein
MGDAIQIELACRILNAVPDGNVEIKFVTSGPPAMQPYLARGTAGLSGGVAQNTPCERDIARARRIDDRAQDR